MAIPGISGIHFKYTFGGGILWSFNQRSDEHECADRLCPS
ncbi:hypothetical protein C7S13_4400 [Burkholderia cepacia]|nr:hypothetical protein [Burkholderia cepacia]